VYTPDAVPEDRNTNSEVTTIMAIDKDTSSTVKYSIIGGNTYDAFYIERETGKIKIKNTLDYENITSVNN